MNLKDKQATLRKHVNDIIDTLELKKTDSLIDTPNRVAKMLVDEMFIGLDDSNFPSYKMFDIEDGYNEPIIVDNISIFSICEHHFLPFFGKAKFSYVPNKKVIGLSKIPRIIDFLARKPQLQERLTLEIFQTFKKILNTEDISIELQCEHLCAKIRGIKDDCCMNTIKRGGVFLK